MTEVSPLGNEPWPWTFSVGQTPHNVSSALVQNAEYSRLPNGPFDSFLFQDMFTGNVYHSTIYILLPKQISKPAQTSIGRAIVSTPFVSFEWKNEITLLLIMK